MAKQKFILPEVSYHNQIYSDVFNFPGLLDLNLVINLMEKVDENKSFNQVLREELLNGSIGQTIGVENFEFDQGELQSKYQRIGNQIIDDLYKFHAQHFSDLDIESPQLVEWLYLQDAFGSLCMAEKSKLQSLLKVYDINDRNISENDGPEICILDFFIDFQELFQNLQLITKKYGMKEFAYTSITQLCFTMTYAKIQLAFQRTIGHIEFDSKGTVIPSSKAELIRARRKTKEGKSIKFEDEELPEINSVGGFVFFDHVIKTTKKNKTGSYNMSSYMILIFNFICAESKIGELSGRQKYLAVYKFFRIIVPERKLCKNESEFKLRDYDEHTDFEEYQITNVKSLLGVTK